MAYLSPIQFSDSNILGTTLNGGIGSGDNTLTLTSAAVLGCPTSPSFDILIDNEYITVNGISGNVCTPLSRGANGSTPASHANGAPVYSPITIGMITAAMARIDQANAAGFQSPVFTPSGLYSAVNVTSRIVGAVAPGAGTAWTPAGGPYNVGDIVWDVSNAAYYLCSVAGSPGTWIAAPSLKLAQTWVLAQTFSSTITASGEVSAPDFKATGAASLGSPRSGRFVGEWTTIGAPTGLTAQLGDYGYDGNFNTWICSSAGTPGTWRPSGIHLLESQVLSAVTSATIPASGVLPTGYRNLVVRWKLRGSTAAGSVQFSIRPNADTTIANYAYQYMTAVAATQTDGGVDGTFVGFPATITGSTAPANGFGIGEARFWDYNSTSDQKQGLQWTCYRSSTGTNGQQILEQGNIWLSVAAITTLQLLMASGNFSGRIDTYGE